MYNLPFLPTIIISILVSVIEIIYISRWLLLLRYDQNLINRDRDEFYKQYDKFVNKQVSKMLGDSPDKLPDEYETHMHLCQDQRKAAYTHYSRHLQIISLFSAIIVLPVSLAMLFFLISLYTNDLSNWYLGIPAIILFLSVAFRVVILKQNAQFHHSVMMKTILKKVKNKI